MSDRSFPILPCILALGFFAYLLVLPSGSAAGVEPDIRLLVKENQARVVLRADSMDVETSHGVGWKDRIKRVRAVAFHGKGDLVVLEGVGVTARTVQIRPRRGLLRFDGKSHRGVFTITSSGSSLNVVARLPVESYLVGVVNGEVDSHWPQEAVMAQVVASRTYALFRLQEKRALFDLRPDVLDQVYAGAGSEDPEAAEAVRRTRGIVLTRDGMLIPAFFHSSCGGFTSSVEEIWGVGHPSLQGVKCGECEGAPRSTWQLTLPTEEVRDAAGRFYPDAGGITSLGISRRTADGRVRALFLGTDTGKMLVDAGDFRKVLGYERLPSTRFTLGQKAGMIIFTGSGRGHGVGLCQWGARGSALSGMDYRQILRKYYPGAQIEKIY